ncbi:MAG: ABC transporter substrate-binding protein [Pseudomonadota bacterium]|nr:ABC transporter substrate-binding protein [Pseudomonadota bacterium]
MSRSVFVPVLRLAIVTGLASLGLLSLSLPGGASAWAAGTLIWGMPAETDILDPQATGGWSTYQITYQIFEGLVKEDLTKADVPTPPIVPALAESWTISPDGLQYTFKLRPGIRFHDGTPFDAAAVKFNFERFCDKNSPNYYPKTASFVAAYVKWIKAVEVLDPMSVRITLTAPNYEWLRQGLQSYGQPLIISPAAVAKYGNAGIALHPIGTGPFRFVERTQGVRTVLERNPDYWGRKALLDRVVFRPLQDPATRVNALEDGEVQMITTPPWDEIEGLVKDGFKLSTNANVPYINFLYLNNHFKPFQDERVRRAVNMAIDREGIARDIYRKTGRAEFGMLSPGTYAYDPEFQSYKYDPAAAKKLLADAGYPNGFTTVFELPQYGTGELVETWIQRDLKKIGIDVQLRKFEWVTYMGLWAKGMTDDIGMDEIGWGMSTPAWINLVVQCDSVSPNGENSGYYCNHDVDKVLTQALLTEDHKAATALYQKANRMVMDDAAYVPYVDDLQPVILSAKVHGFVNPPEDWFDLSTVSVE